MKRLAYKMSNKNSARENIMLKHVETDFIFQLNGYDYVLPEELIAQEPSQKREGSRLLIFDKKTNTLTDSFFTEIINELPKNALIIANNSRVVPARILGTRKTGSKVEMLLISPVALLEQNAKQKKHGQKSATAQVLLKGSKRIKIGEELSFHSLTVKILDKQDFGKHSVELTWKNSLVTELETYGLLPLPPYIKRPNGPSNYDLDRYQTVYANATQSGSVAAPTAGLHFTKEIQKNLLEKGFLWEEVTLHVGYGTFSPVRSDDIREHDMHAEYVEISEKTSRAILKAKAENRPIITIGTTATRSLEGMAKAYSQFKKEGYSADFTLNTESENGIYIKDKGLNNKVLNNKELNDKTLKDKVPNVCLEKNCQNTYTENTVQDTILPASGCFGYTNIFIYPGKKFNVVDGILTNFHLPKSSLLMLVCAFAGYENTMSAYRHAIAEKYRFFSYGDAMLIRSQ